MSMSGGVRRPVPGRTSKVKVPKRHGPPLEDTWLKLAKAISEIQRHNASKLSFEEHYRYAYQMVLHKQGDQLFYGVRDLVAKHLDAEATDRIKPTFPSASTSNLTSAPSLGGHPPVPDVHSSPRGVQDSPGGAAADKGKGKARADNTIASGVGGAATDRLARVQAGERFLRSVKEVWEGHVACMKKLRDVLKYMDKVYTVSPGNGQPSMPTVWDLGLFLFLTHVVRSALLPIGPILLSSLLTQIRLDRDGETINRSIVKSCTDMLGDLSNASHDTISRIGDRDGGHPGGMTLADAGESVYKTDFEGQFLVESGEYYRLEGERLLASCDAPEYLRKVERRLAEEEIRISHYLHPSTEQPLTSILHEYLLTTHISGILHHPSSGLDQMVEADRAADLARLYRLFGRIPPKGHLSLKDGLKDWIKGRGAKINEGLSIIAGAAAGGTSAMDAGAGTGPENPGGATTTTNAALQWVQNVLDLRDKFLAMLAQAFSNDKSFQTAINEAFESFVNANRKAPEYISLFLDDNLKKGLKGKNEDEVDQVLEKTISVFRYLSEKDVFERYYKGHLAKRLLFGRSISDDAERSMLSKLKVECGAAFTRDLEGMLKDMKMSGEMAKSYKDWSVRPGALRTNIDMTVTVGSSSMWPMNQTKATCVFPPDFENAVKSYERFYSSRHSGRKLAWHPELGNVDMRVRFRKATHELNVSTFSAVVLLLFQNLGEEDQLTFPDIKSATVIPDADLRRTLQSLACAKYKILTKTPKGRDINDGDRFAFNAGFSSPMSRIKILTVTNKVESGEEAKETQDRVEEDRRLMTEACIVRTLKTRKTLGFAELSTEVISQLGRRFKPTPQVIKTAVERLIDKEYLKRDPADRKLLTYLA